MENLDSLDNFNIKGLKGLSVNGTLDFETMKNQDFSELKFLFIRSNRHVYDVKLSIYDTLSEFIDGEMSLSDLAKLFLKEYVTSFITS